MKRLESQGSESYSRKAYERLEEDAAYARELAEKEVKQGDNEDAVRHLGIANKFSKEMDKQVDMAWDEAAESHENVFGRKVARATVEDGPREDVEQLVEAKVERRSLHEMEKDIIDSITEHFDDVENIPETDQEVLELIKAAQSSLLEEYGQQLKLSDRPSRSRIDLQDVGNHVNSVWRTAVRDVEFLRDSGADMDGTYAERRKRVSEIIIEQRRTSSGEASESDAVDFAINE